MIFKPLVTPERFSDVSCLDGQAFGVETLCNSQCGDIKMNPCSRRRLREMLLSNQENTERVLGYDLSPRYRYEDVVWDGISRIQLHHGPVSIINVIQQVDPLSESSFDVTIFFAENVSVSTDGDGVHYVRVSSAFVKNPEHAVFRRTDNNGVILHDTAARAYPSRDGADWLIAVDTRESTVNVHHCKYAFVLTDADLICDEGTEIAAVKPDTEIYIPFAQAPFEHDGDMVYTFYAWSLVDPSFEDDSNISLTNGQFYKLLQSVDLVCLSDVYQAPVVIEDSDGCSCSSNCSICDSESDIGFEILSDNVIELSVNRCKFKCSPRYPIKVRIYYKTDPTLVEPNLSIISEAIIYLTAAELPLKDCGCPEPKEGFIHIAQEVYGDIKINQVTGDEHIPVRYGQRHGQVVYWDYIGRTVKKRPAIIA